MATRKRTHSAAHRKAISAGLKRYHASKKGGKKSTSKSASRSSSTKYKSRSSGKTVSRPRDPGDYHGTSVTAKKFRKSDNIVRRGINRKLKSRNLHMRLR